MTDDVPGFRSKSLVVVTSLLDEQTVPRADLTALYRQRRVVELHLRDIQTTMELDVLRCKTPARVRLELWTGLLAYNLIRQSMLQSATATQQPPRQLSFAATMQMLASTWLTAAVLPPTDSRPGTNPREVIGRSSNLPPLISLRLAHGASHKVGHRPDRVEPRAIKRRPSQHDLLNKPRAEARANLITRRVA